MSQPSTKSPRDDGAMRLIERAAAVLRALADRPGGASLGEIARATGLARSTVQRVVGALAAERLISVGAEAGSVRLGVEIARLASFVQSDARALLRPLAEDLLRRAQETVDVSILDDGKAVVIDQLVSPQSLRVVSHVGRPLPLHATASGKAHLSGLDPVARRALLAGTLEATTDNTRTRAAALLKEIEESARRGYFIDDEEFAEGVCALAVFAPLPGGGNFALAISMPASRFASQRKDYVAAMLRTRAALQSAS